ncbi:MAG: serine/threonine protein kinase [Chloroflexi bacterium]|nr:serine/threonine protein kinase [Chloroflexota bacterium]
MDFDPVGAVIGPYELGDRIGAGGTASVYRAYDRAQRRFVAVKLLPAGQRERFEHEARLASRLDHPHILPVYDFGQHAGAPYLVMQLASGGTLKERIARGPLPYPDLLRILEQIASALDYAHRRGVIHRDLKPANILFDSEGRAFLADFGIAHLRSAGDPLDGANIFAGTAAYASPEQCRGESLTSASDIYALGVVVYAMLTGALPFDGPTPLAIMHRHLHAPPPDPRRTRSDLPPGVTPVLRRALAKPPDARFHTAMALHAALYDALRPPPPPAPAAPDPPPVEASRRWPAWAIWGLLGFLMLAALAIILIAAFMR